jgi:hypothetical protein
MFLAIFGGALIVREYVCLESGFTVNGYWINNSVCLVPIITVLVIFFVVRKEG